MKAMNIHTVYTDQSGRLYKPFDVDYMPCNVVDPVGHPTHPDVSTANVVSELHKTVSQSQRQKLDVRLITNPQQLTVTAGGLELQLNVVVKTFDSTADT